MRLKRRGLQYVVLAALTVGTLSCGGGDPKAAQQVLDEAMTQFEAALKDLESANYERAKLDFEELVDDTSELSLALDSRPELKAQARWAFVVANSLFQVNRWVDTLSTVLALAGPLFGNSGKPDNQRTLLLQAFDEVYALQNGATPAGGGGIVAPILDGFLTDFISFFNSNLRQMERLRQSEVAQTFSINFRALPVRIAGFDIMDLKGEHDMGEVFLIESLYRLINGVLTAVIALDLTVNIPEPALIDRTLDVIAELSDGQDPVGAAVSLAAAYIFDQDRLLGLASADDMRAAGDFFEDGFLSILQGIEFMQAELANDSDQSNDLIGFLPANNDNPMRLELHIDFRPTPVPGVDTTKLRDLKIALDDDILNSLDNISQAFGGTPGARVNWARDIVPLLSLAVVTLLQSGAFDGLISAALDSAALDQGTVSSINSLLNSDLLQTNVVQGLILGFIPDVFEFDVGAYFEKNPLPPRNFLPFWTSPVEVTQVVNGQEKLVKDWSSPTLLISWECNDALDDVPFNAPLNAKTVEPGAQTFLFCDADMNHQLLDCDLFAPDGVCVTGAGLEITSPPDAAIIGMLDDTRSPTFNSMHEDFLNNLREMGTDNPTVPNSTALGIRRDGIVSVLPYIAFRDPSFGGSLWIKLNEGNNEELDEFVTGDRFRLASNRSLNALVHTLFDEILDLL